MFPLSLPFSRDVDTKTLSAHATTAGRSGVPANARAVYEEIRRRRIGLLAELHQLNQIEAEMRKIYKTARATRKPKRKK